MSIWIAGIVASSLAASSPATVGDVGWLAGDWGQESGDRWTEESWAPPRGGMMVGYSRSGRGESVREFEFIRIVPGADGTLAYIAQPQGGTPVAFALVRQDGSSATFENAAHDYPQRIAYARSGDTLTATISKIDGSKARSWTYRRR